MVIPLIKAFHMDSGVAPSGEISPLTAGDPYKHNKEGQP